MSRPLASDDLVNLFGYDSLSSLAVPSPEKLLGFNQVPADSKRHQQDSAGKVPQQSKSQQQQSSTLAVLLDSPDISEPLSVERRTDAAALDMLASLGQSSKNMGAELPDNFLDPDSDPSDGDSPQVVNSNPGCSAPNSLDAHFPTPPTSVETNGPLSNLRGTTPAAQTEHQQNEIQICHQINQLSSSYHGASEKQNPAARTVLIDSATDNSSRNSDVVFQSDSLCNFVEGERYRPLELVDEASSTTDGDMVRLKSTSALVSLSSLRHEPSTLKCRSATPSIMSRATPSNSNTCHVSNNKRPLSPRSFINQLELEKNDGIFVGGGDVDQIKQQHSTDVKSQNLKNFECLTPDNLLNILIEMSDSVLDFHRDSNFDMAPLCACTNSPLKGVDLPYLRLANDADDGSVNGDGGDGSHWPGPINECSCGYSAVFNRKVAAFGAGLLRDDERELLHSSQSLKAILKFAKVINQDHQPQAAIDKPLIKLFQKMCSVATPPIPFIAHIARQQRSSAAPWMDSSQIPSKSYLKRMEIADRHSSIPMCRCRSCFAESIEANSVFISALCQFLESDVMDNISADCSDCFFLHNWINSGDCRSKETNCSTNELFTVVAQIHPFVTNSKPSVPIPSYPTSSKTRNQEVENMKNSQSSTCLNLKSLFHSSSEKMTSAVPIPFVMASCEKEAVQLAPMAMGPCWEKNNLEPVAGSGRRLCHFTVRPSLLPPESNFDDEEPTEVLALKYFTAEVGRVMVDCRLASVHTSLEDASFSFFSLHPQYAQKVPRMPIVLGGIEGSPATPGRQQSKANAQNDWLRTVKKLVIDALQDRELVESSYDGCICYVVVRDQSVANHVLKMFSTLLESLPNDDYRDRLVLQMVPLSFAHLIWSGAHSAVQAEIRRLAFSIYTQIGARWRIDRGERALTDAGPLPILRESVILSDQRLKHTKYSPENATGLWDGPLRWPHSPIAVLARMKDQQTRLAECCGQKSDNTMVVYASYCPTPDQRYLLVSMTDDCGYINKTGVLALEQPDAMESAGKCGNKKRRKRPPIAHAAVERVWHWLISSATHSKLAVPIRLVLTRLGRLGHGEVRSWSSLMSRQHLQNIANKLQQHCNHCGALSSTEVPCIISSCLISLEPHPWLRLMSSANSTPVATSVQMGAGLSEQSNHYGDYKPAGKILTCTGSAAFSSTHVFAFPTSAAIQAQSSHTGPDEPMAGDSDMLELFPDFLQDKDMLDIPSPSAGLTDYSDFGNMSTSGGPQMTSRQNSANGGWPRQSASGGMGADNVFGGQHHGSVFETTSANQAGSSLLQQPLAVAFVVSSAPMGPSLPEWLCALIRDAGITEDRYERTTCRPQNITDKPAILRAALHVHTASILPGPAGSGGSGGLGTGGSSSTTPQGSSTTAAPEHPLDSRRTVDVLRYAGMKISIYFNRLFVNYFFFKFHPQQSKNMMPCLG